MVVALMLSCTPQGGEALDAEWLGSPKGYADADGDGFGTARGDCDDNDPDVRPGRDELCDGIDQDCDDRVDEGCLGRVARLSFEHRIVNLGPFFVAGAAAMSYRNEDGDLLCTLSAELAGSDPPDGCPDCEWAFGVTVAAVELSGDHCDTVNYNDITIAGYLANPDWMIHSSILGYGYTYLDEPDRYGRSGRVILSGDGDEWGVTSYNGRSDNMFTVVRPGGSGGLVTMWREIDTTRRGDGYFDYYY